MCAGSAASTGEGERLASKASSCARCLRRSIWDSTIPSSSRTPARWAARFFGFIQSVVTLRGGKRADKVRCEAKDSRIRIYKQSVWAVAAAWRLAACTPTRRASVKLTLHRQCVCTPSWPLGRFASQLAPGGAPRPA